MKNFKIFMGIVVLLTSFVLSACSDESNIIDKKEYSLTIASKKVLGVVSSCGCNSLAEVYAAKKDNSDTWIQQSAIDGFEYEAGYEYIIQVKETSYLDYNRSEPSWTEYKMIKLISKEKKTSESLPKNFIPDWYHSK
jgi:hypothetical protein